MTEPPAQPQAAPERIYIHPTSSDWHPNRWPLEPEEYVEYVAEGYEYEGPVPAVSWGDSGNSAYVTDPQRAHDLGRYFEVIKVTE